MGMKRIAEELNTGGTLHRGVKWTVGHVEHVLSNSVYVGKYITFRRDSHNRCAHPKDRWITTNVEPLLDEAEFDAVHKLLEARRPPNTRTE